jgi:hypothetical protein
VLDELAATVDAGELDQLAGVTVGPVRLRAPLAAAAPLVTSTLDGLIVFDERQLDLGAPFDWQLLPRSRAQSGGRIDELLSLPFGGPQRIVLASASTEAESGLKGLRRHKGIRPGSELFLATMSLIARGAETVLVSRWRTGGRTNLQLVREFVQELPHVPAAEAWQRSILVTRTTQLEPAHEPRLKQPDVVGEAPNAEHPFFWAGYLLVDRGANAGSEAKPPGEEEEPGDEGKRAVEVGGEEKTGREKPAAATATPPADPAHSPPAATNDESNPPATS